MFSPIRARGVAALGMGGGLGWAVLPAAVGTPAGPVLAVGSALALTVAVAGLFHWYEPSLGLAGRTGSIIAGSGLAIIAVAAGFSAIGPRQPVLTGAFVGVAAVAVGSATLAVDWYRAGLVPPATALAVAVAIPLSVLVNATLVRLLGVGIGLYGLAWVILGYHVWTEAGEQLLATSDTSPDTDR